MLQCRVMNKQKMWQRHKSKSCNEWICTHIIMSIYLSRPFQRLCTAVCRTQSSSMLPESTLSWAICLKIIWAKLILIKLKSFSVEKTHQHSSPSFQTAGKWNKSARKSTSTALNEVYSYLFCTLWQYETELWPPRPLSVSPSVFLYPSTLSSILAFLGHLPHTYVLWNTHTPHLKTHRDTSGRRLCCWSCVNQGNGSNAASAFLYLKSAFIWQYTILSQRWVFRFSTLILTAK